MNKNFFLIVMLLACFGSITSLSAHRFFFGITDINVNHQNDQIEIIHQFTIHDLENLIAEQQQINFSPEHPRYEQLIRQYFENHFKIQNNNTSIVLTWVGLELVRDKLFIYQEAKYPKFLIGLVVKNDLLTDTYAKQVNTVNFQDNNLKGSLTFNKSQQVAKIIANN
jgi:uncharacterized protein DUF6702